MDDKPIGVLWVMPVFPFPADTGTKIHLAGAAGSMSGRYRVSLVGMYDGRRENPPSDADLREARKYFQRVSCFRRGYVGWGGRLGKLLYAVFGPEPLYVANCTAAEARPEVERVIAEEKCRLVQADEIYTARYAVDLAGVRKILVLHNVDSRMLYRSFLYHPNPLRKLFFLLQFWKMRSYEKKVIPKFDRCFCVSETDREIFERIFHGRISFGVFSNGVDTKAKAVLPRPGNRDLLFVGTLDYHPNVLAVEWFLKRIFPLVLNSLPDVRLLVAGCHPPDRLKKWAQRLPVTFAGYVDNIEDSYRRAAIAVVPIRIGSGTRGKILEAMAYGRPVVSTTVGAEGLKVSAGRDILIADRPGDFAGSVVSLLRDAGLYGRVAANARRLVEEKYDWQPIAAELEKSYREILEST